MTTLTLPQGTRFAIATTIGAVKTFTAASNAASTVLSFASDPSFAVNDICHVVTSGWEDLVNIVARVSAISGSGPYLVTLEDIDTASTTRFPAGEGAGTCKEITAWTSIPLVGLAERAGGEVEQIPTPLLSRGKVATLQGNQSGTVYTLPCYFTQPMGAGFLAARAAMKAASVVAMRRSHPAGDVQYAAANWATGDSSSLDRGAARSVPCTVTLQNDETSYLAV